MVAKDAKKEDKLSVLVIADNFNPRLVPLTLDKPLVSAVFVGEFLSQACLSVAGVRLIDLVLEWLSRLNANVFVAAGSLDKPMVESIKR